MLIRPEGGPDGAMSLVLRRVDLKHIKLVGRSNKQFLAFTKDFVREDAVGKIAKFWRRYGWTMKMKDLAGAYRTVKLTELDARGMGFEFIVQYLRKSFVLKVSLLFYRRILYGAADIVKIRLHDLSEHEEKPNIRVFLCGYMISLISSWGVFLSRIFLQIWWRLSPRSTPSSSALLMPGKSPI